MPIILAHAEPPTVVAPPPEPPVLTNPDWVQKPKAEDVGKFYPSAAIGKNLAGSVIIHCAVDVAGALVDCTVAAEDPPGMGFGKAGLAVAAKFKMRSATKDGVPVAGYVVNIPIRFVMPGFELPPVRAVQPGAREGRVKLDCLVAFDGGLENCLVLDDAVARPDLRDAAMKVAAKIAVPAGLIGGVRIVLPVHVVPPPE